MCVCELGSKYLQLLFKSSSCITSKILSNFILIEHIQKKSRSREFSSSCSNSALFMNSGWVKETYFGLDSQNPRWGRGYSDPWSSSSLFSPMYCPAQHSKKVPLNCRCHLQLPCWLAAGKCLHQSVPMIILHLLYMNRTVSIRGGTVQPLGRCRGEKSPLDLQLC